jgi:hypothetical protein
MIRASSQIRRVAGSGDRCHLLQGPRLSAAQRSRVCSIAETLQDRRSILRELGTAVMTMQLLNDQQQAAVAASCPSTTTGPSGLEWCDTAEGDGPLPVRGSLIRLV